MLGVEEARDIILGSTLNLGTSTVDISSGLYRILAEDIYSSENIPPFDNSAMDGFAVISERIKGASEDCPVVLKIAGNLQAGYVSKDAVKGYKTVRIMTGAPVPKGADAVVAMEFTEACGDTVKIFKEVLKGENIRLTGSDVRKNQLVIPKGKLLRPVEIGMLAALNITRVKVVRRPRISILATGDELVNPGEKLLPGKIRNINSYSLLAEIIRHGGKPVNLGVAKDNREVLFEKLKNVRNSDILIISGGVSVGDYDYVRRVLSDIGMIEKFWKVSIKPGKPVLFGVIKNTLVFGLPGNPVASMVTFQQFVLPAIYKLQRKGEKPWRELEAVFEGEFENKPGFTSFIRGKTFIREGRLHVRPIGSQSSGAFSSLVLADCYIIVPENITRIKSGYTLTIQINDEIGEI